MQALCRVTSTDAMSIQIYSEEYCTYQYLISK